jgi:hypothetical protein
VRRPTVEDEVLRRGAVHPPRVREEPEVGSGVLPPLVRTGPHDVLKVARGAPCVYTVHV